MLPVLAGQRSVRYWKKIQLPYWYPLLWKTSSGT